MSMPLPLSAVIVASSEADLGGIRKRVVGLRRPGIAPRYTLATLAKPGAFSKHKHFPRLAPQEFALWIALDERALMAAEEAYKAAMNSNGYGRGFYDTHLPDPVCFAANEKELQALVDRAWEAFCATS